MRFVPLCFLALLFSFSGFAKDGRYIVIFHPTIRADSVLLDTQTGRIWKDTCFKEENDKCTVNAFAEQTVVGITVPEKDFNRFLENLNKK
ncbi:MAG: hypothetical protein V4598_06510 [Bdellovibrionota bacterium]